ncbi:proline racemase family protein [Streptomyces sp. 4N509B]|uniref:proline racemase family protein n=1 Tax=Streptomyces sp. 4N509B TaxID=3457413 RepID=UPI003FD2C8AE
MRSRRVFHTVESHTEGMPTRVVTGGVGTLPGATMAERREWFARHSDDVRTLLMYEPRGHAAMSGAILQPPTRPDADVGVLFIEVSGLLPMCGHGTIGVATVLVETGMVEVTEPVTTIRLDVPAGLVTAEVAVEDGAARSVTIRNVPSYAVGLDQRVEVPGLGEVRYDMAFGGNFYAIVELAELGLPFDRAAKDELLTAGLAIMRAINATEPPRHPERPDIHGCHHVYLAAPGSTAAHSRHAMAIHPGWFDRSPCGTGTSARMAQLHARGELGLHQDFVNESFIGSRFTGRLVETTTVGGTGAAGGAGRAIPAVVPTITGRAWVTGTAQYHLDPTDPFPAGFLL